MGSGRQIKRDSPAPLTIPCGYMNDTGTNDDRVPDGPSCRDLDYVSGYYRYTKASLSNCWRSVFDSAR